MCDPTEDRCAYPDDECTSGYRFPAQTDRGLALECTQASATGTGSTSTGLATGDAASGSTSADGDAESSGTTGECVLAPSGPLLVDPDTYDGPIERLAIVASGAPGIRIVSVPNARIADVEIHHAINMAIEVVDSPGLVIERVSIFNDGAPTRPDMPSEGAAGVGEIGIWLLESPGAMLRDIRIRDPLTGILVQQSDDVTIQDLVVHNARGRPVDTGGDCVRIEGSARPTVERFGCINDPTLGIAHGGVFVDGSVDVTIRDGLVTDLLHERGTGVRIHDGLGRGTTLVQDVDTFRSNFTCILVRDGHDVELAGTRCHGVPIDVDPLGTYGWISEGRRIGSVRVTEGVHDNVDYLSLGPFEVFEVEQLRFDPVGPPAVRPPCSP